MNHGSTSVAKTNSRFIPFVPAYDGDRWKCKETSNQEGVFYSFARYAIAEALRSVPKRTGTVLMPALSCRALVEAVLRSSNQPKFYDIQENFKIGFNDIATYLSDDIIAIIAVSYFGWETVQIQDLAENVPDRIFCLVDCAQGLPLEAHNKIFDHVYSYRKTLGIPDGAVWISRQFPSMILQRNPQRKEPIWQREAYLIKMIGESKGSIEITHIEELLDERNHIRHNRDFNWSSAPPSELARETWDEVDFEKIALARRENSKLYLSKLKDIPGVIIAFDQIPNNSSPLGFPIWVEDAEDFAKQLWKNGIESARWWRELPIGKETFKFPNSDRASKCLVQLPVHQGLEPEDIQYVVDVIAAIVI